MEERFIELIREHEQIPEQKLRVALKIAKQTREPMLDVVIRAGLLPSRIATRYWADALDYPFVELDPETVDVNAVKMVPQEDAETYHYVPFRLEDRKLSVAIYDVRNLFKLDALKRFWDLEFHIADLDNINEVLAAVYEEDAAFDAEVEKNQAAALAGTTVPGQHDPPYVRLVNLFIEKGVVDRATDIHISPDEDTTHVSYRVDGIVIPAYILPKQLHTGLVTRIKVLAGLNIAESRKPQDGAITYEYSGRPVDIRVSTSPTDEGENVVLRLLDKAKVVMGLSNLGFTEEQYQEIVELSKKPYGIVLSAGPTGSGKTTTLYSTLGEIDALQRNILTIEDPIEYRIPYIKQSQVNEKAGHTFATAIRHFLRQDPDVILVGEIRDLETARIAFQAAMTGHLVFSTIHTNDAASTIARLMDLGVEAYLIPSSLRAVMAQRLVRRVCRRCGERYEFTPEEREKYDLDDYEITSEIRGRGCEVCNYTGYKGRTAIIEILHMTPKISELVIQKYSADYIKMAARQEGMRTMLEDGMEKVRQGVTTVEEIYRMTG